MYAEYLYRKTGRKKKTQPEGKGKEMTEADGGIKCECNGNK
jgi:hypothetical protein